MLKLQAEFPAEDTSTKSKNKQAPGWTFWATHAPAYKS